MNAEQIYAQLKERRFREAGNSLATFWRELRWEIRLAIVAALLSLLFIWILSVWDWVGGLLALPLGLGALIAAARPTPALGWVDGLVRWAEAKRQQALAKGTFFAKWVRRPFYAGLTGPAGLTAGVNDPYLRAGATVALQSYAVYLSLVLAYYVIYGVLVLLCAVALLWLLVRAFSESSGGSSRVVSHVVSRGVRWGRSGHSEERADFFGQKYAQHYDDEYNQVGRTETREDFFGQPYQQHNSPEGDYTGHSEERADLFGDRYVQHFNEQGDAAGSAESRADFFGQPYVQHFDEDGNPVGRSEEREDLFGQKYIKHEEE